MALTRVLLRRRKSLSSFARESCLSRSMVLGLIVFSLPMLMGCAAEGVAELVQALEIRGLIVAKFGGAMPQMNRSDSKGSSKADQPRPNRSRRSMPQMNRQ